jgi:hypothetical protein
VFVIFLLLLAVLAVFVVRFSIKLSRERRTGPETTRRRSRRRPPTSGPSG